MNEPDFDDGAGQSTPIPQDEPQAQVGGRGIQPSIWDQLRTLWRKWTGTFKDTGNAKTVLAVLHLRGELARDPDYWEVWQSNFACVVADQLRSEFFELTQQQAMEIGNRCADKIMDHFFNAPRKPEHYP